MTELRTLVIRIKPEFGHLSFFLILIIVLGSTSTTVSPLKNGGETSETKSATDYSSLMNRVNQDNIQAHLRFLSGLGSRVVGYPGYWTAADYVHDWFTRYLTNVSIQEFNYPSPIDHGANLTVTSPIKETFSIYSLWPNLVCPSTLPPGGIDGKIVYGGDGGLEMLDGKEIEGSIVLVDFNNHGKWIYPLELGAKAVILMEPDFTTFIEANYNFMLQIPYNFPRFYIKASDASSLLSLLRDGVVQVHVEANSSWEIVKGRNIVGFLRGTEYPDRYIIVSSQFDSWSVVPSISPGAEEAVGISVLLELARLFSGERPKFSIMFVAFSGTHEGLTGAREFIWDHLQWFRDRRIILQSEIDLTTGSDTLVMDYGDQMVFENIPTYRMDPLKTYIDTLATGITQTMGEDYKYIMWDVGAPVKNREQLDKYASNCEVLGWINGPDFRLASFRDSRVYVSTPLDSFENLAARLKNLEPLSRLVYAILHNISNLGYNDLVSNYLSRFADLPLEDKAIFNLRGTVAIFNVTEAWYTPVPNALVAVMAQYRGRNLITYADEDGRYSIRMLPTSSSYRYFYPSSSVFGNEFMDIQPYIVDNKTGNVLFAPDQGVWAYYRYPIKDANGDQGFNVIFKCATVFVPSIVDPETLIAPNIDGDIMKWITILDHNTHTQTDSHGTQTISPVLDDKIALFVPTNRPVSFLLQTIYAEKLPLAFLLNSTLSDPEGSGYVLEGGEQFVFSFLPLKLARELYRIDEARIRSLKGAIGFVKEYPLHDRVHALINEAEEALKNYQYSKFYTYAYEAWSNERGVYIEIRSDVDDSVNAIPLFGFLLVVFAILMERLIFSAESFKRVIILSAIFCIFYTVLSLVHPGFRLASNSLVVVLGVSMILLSIPIVGIVFMNFIDLLKRIRKKVLGAHFVEARRVSEITTSLMLGVEHMKRRGLRTSLTLVSITLIVVALVCFTAIQPMKQVRYVELGTKPQYQGITIKPSVFGWWPSSWSGGGWPSRPLGAPMGTRMPNVLKALVGPKADIAPIAWRYSPNIASSSGFAVTSGNKSAAILGIVGVTAEFSQELLAPYLKGGRPLNEYDHLSAIVSETTARALGIDTFPANIELCQMQLHLVGAVKDEFPRAFRNLDDVGVYPRDLTIPGSLPDLSATQLNPSYVMIVPIDYAIELGAQIVEANIVFKGPSDVAKVAESIFTMFPSLEIYAAAGSSAVLYTKEASLRVLGVEFQVPAMVICAMVILNLMLANVYERTREIGILSSLGLSPTQIASVFLVESFVYAIVSAFVGYLFAITLGFITSMYVPSVPINFASGWIVNAIVISVAITLLSTVYPALKASRAVTPSLQRAWTFTTKPVGDEWSIPMPFRTSAVEEAKGILAFLAEFLHNHEAWDSKIFRSSSAEYKEIEEADRQIMSLTSEIRLEPYEQAIVQQTDLSLIKSKENPEWSLHILIKRTSGPKAVWERSNYAACDEIRKQMLLWRGLSQEDKKKYSESIQK